MILTVGAVGGTRSGGVASSDSFNKREKAAEDMVLLTPPHYFEREITDDVVHETTRGGEVEEFEGESC